MNTKRLYLHKFGLEKVLLAIFIIVVIPPFVIQIIVNNNFVNIYEQQLITTNMQSVNDFKLNMEYNLKEVINASLTIYSDNKCVDILKKPIDRPLIEKRNDYFSFQSYIKHIITVSFIRGVYIYSLDGDCYDGNCNIGFLDVDEKLPYGKWLDSVKPNNNKINFLGTHQPKQLVEGLPVFSLIRNIIDPDTGKCLGLMLIDMNPEMFGATFSQNKDSLNRNFLIVGKDYNIIYHTKKEYIMRCLEESQLISIFSSKKGRLIYTSNNTEYLASYDTSSLTGWKVISITPLNTVIESANVIKSSIIWIIVSFVVFAVISSFLFSLFISKPLKRLTIKMKAVEEGNFSVLPDLGGTKEVYLLGKVFNSMLVKIKHLLQNEFQLKLLKKDAEFKALQAQINPHFLYNTLESISVLADMKEAPEISKTCIVLSNMFRYSIDRGNEVVSLRQELEHVQCYISIIKLRFEDLIEVNVDIDRELYDYIILKLILQPLVENCIIHGFEYIDQKGIININAKKENDRILINIIDNGKGIPADTLKEIEEMLFANDSNDMISIWQGKSKSIGLKNIHLRLSSYFGSQFGIMEIDSLLNKGTRITVVIPAVRQKKVGDI